MSRHHMKPGGPVPFTPKEERDRDAEEAGFSAAAPMKQWEADIRASDADGMTRHVENMIDSMDAAQKANLDPVTMGKFNEKKAVRARRPSES